jgi:cytochrome P450 family 110
MTGHQRATTEVPSPTAADVRDGLPLGPASSRLVQTYRYTTDPFDYLDECASRFGEIFTIRLLGTRPWVVLTAPSLVKAMFTAPPDVVHAGEANFSVFGPIAGPASVFTMDERAHLERRHLLLPQFHGERMRVYFDLMRRIVSDTVAHWPEGEAFSLHPQMQQITLKTILTGVFGVPADARDARDRALADALIDLANNAVGSSLLLMPALQRDLGPWSPWGRVVRIIRRADAAIYEEIRRRRTEPDAASRPDILSLLLQVCDESGAPLSDRELRDELVVMLTAGHETTGTALAWAFERILSLADVEARLRRELADVVGEGPLDASHLSKLEYLDAFIKESLRIRPIMPMAGARLVQRPFEIGGYRVPPGAIVANSMYLLHRRSDVYPEPEAFRPERFLGKRVIDPYEWAPFGGGIRRCLGMPFAIFEMKTVIATVLLEARLSTSRPNARAVPRGFFVVPRDGLRVALESRVSVRPGHAVTVSA